MEVTGDFKKTEVGIIPTDWAVLPVASLGETKRGASSLCIKYRTLGGVRLIRINDFFQDKPVFVEPTDEIMKYSIHERDLLFAGTGASAGASCLPKKEWIGLPHSYNAPRIKVFENHSKEYLLYSLKSPYVRKQQRAWFVGNAQPFLDTKAISSLLIAVPPTLSEQKSIAEALSDADTLIESLEQLLTKKRHLKQGVAQELLTGKKRLPGIEQKTGVKQTDVGVIPVDWEVDKLGVICSMKSGEGITSANIDTFSEYPCYGGNGLRGFATRFTHDGRYALIGRQGALCGNVLGVEGKFFASEHAIVVTASARTDIRWLTFVLGKMRLNRYSESSAQPGLSVSKLLSLVVAHPPTKAEQSAIADMLTDMDAEIAALTAKLAKVRDLKQGMTQELLTGRIRLV